MLLWAKLFWAHLTLAYYEQALSSLEKRGQHHTGEWSHVFWLKHKASNRVVNIERKLSERF